MDPMICKMPKVGHVRSNFRSGNRLIIGCLHKTHTYRLRSESRNQFHGSSEGACVRKEGVKTGVEGKGGRKERGKKGWEWGWVIDVKRSGGSL